MRPTEIPLEDCKDRTTSSLCSICRRIQTQTEVLHKNNATTPAQLLNSWLNILTIKKGQHQWIVNSSTSTSRIRIANTREELNNTILQQLSVKMSPGQLRANDLVKIKGAFSWLTTLPLKSEIELPPEQKGILRCVQP